MKFYINENILKSYLKANKYGGLAMYQAQI